MSADPVVIAGYARTPMGGFQGDLSGLKATELGATRIAPLLTARTQAGHVNLDRLHAIAIEAAEQCERLTIPAIAAPEKLDRFLLSWPKDAPLTAAIERGAESPLRRPAQGLVVGPEGGFTPAELDLLRRCPFVVPASLGPRILRAETACIAGLALLDSESGFLWIRYATAILAAIVGWFAIQGRAWWALPLLAAVIVIWNPVYPFLFHGQLWVAGQFGAVIVFIACAVLIRVKAKKEGARP